VRYQLAFTLGESDRTGKVQALAGIVRRDAGDPWVRAAVLNSLAQGAGEMFSFLAGDARFVDAPGGGEFLRQLVLLVATQNRPAALGNVVDYASKLTRPELAFAVVRALGDGLLRAHSSLAAADPQGKLKPVYARALVAATDPRAPEPVRVEAIQLSGGTSFAEAGALLLSMLDPGQPQAVQVAAVSTLGRFTSPAVATGLVTRWRELTPRVRSQALTILIARPERANVLLNAMEAGIIQRSELATAQITFLRSHRDPAVRGRAQRIFGQPAGGQRPAVVDAFRPALTLVGVADRGRKIFADRCTPCHQLGGQGHAVGPDLASVRSNGKEKILTSILDPNREVAPNYVNYLVETKDGESWLGLIASENAGSVTLRSANGTETVVLRSNIARIQSLGQSLMPEGLEAGLTPRDLADLLEYILVAEPGKTVK
jgi:putative heme-binding domain-containing protein